MKEIRYAVVASGFAFLAVVPIGAHAWSATGHQVVCDIAFLELSAAKQQKVKHILSSDVAAFRKFGPACTWADNQKQSPGTIQNQRRDAHFINVPRNRAQITQDGCEGAPMCLLSAIRDDTKALKTTTGKQQREALKFLGHWVGDIHQPLHVSFKDDTGGNDIGTPQGFDCPNLHNVWDQCIPEDLMVKLHASNAGELARTLRGKISAADRTKWLNSSPVDWAAESYAMARAKDVQYCTLNAQNECCYLKSECVRHARHRTVPITEVYDTSHVDVVATQLQKAGVRLAALLNANLP